MNKDKININVYIYIYSLHMSLKVSYISINQSDGAKGDIFALDKKKKTKNRAFYFYQSLAATLYSYKCFILCVIGF